MDFLAPESRAEIEYHANKDAPKEACGLIYVNDKGHQYYMPCSNICDEPEKHFMLNPVDYYKATIKGTIVAVVHSHPNGETASELDRKACRQSKLPWVIYKIPQAEWLIINP